MLKLGAKSQLLLFINFQSLISFYTITFSCVCVFCPVLRFTGQQPVHNTDSPLQLPVALVELRLSAPPKPDPVPCGGSVGTFSGARVHEDITRPYKCSRFGSQLVFLETRSLPRFSPRMPSADRQCCFFSVHLFGRLKAKDALTRPSAPLERPINYRPLYLDQSYQFVSFNNNLFR